MRCYELQDRIIFPGEAKGPVSSHWDAHYHDPYSLSVGRILSRIIASSCIVYTCIIIILYSTYRGKCAGNLLERADECSGTLTVVVVIIGIVPIIYQYTLCSCIFSCNDTSCDLWYTYSISMPVRRRFTRTGRDYNNTHALRMYYRIQ